MPTPRESQDLYLAGQARPVHLHLPLKGEQTFSSPGYAQITFSGDKAGFLLWATNPLSSRKIDSGSRDCHLELDLCGIPIRVATRIVDVIPRLKPLLVVDTREYIYLDQKRQSFRAPLQATVLCWELSFRDEADSAKTVTRSINISRGGILLWAKQGWPTGQQLQLEIFLEQHYPPLKATGTVVRSERDGKYNLTALQWQELSLREEERIVSYCFAQHRAEIRMLKRSRLAYPDSG